MDDRLSFILHSSCHDLHAMQLYISIISHPFKNVNLAIISFSSICENDEGRNHARQQQVWRFVHQIIVMNLPQLQHSVDFFSNEGKYFDIFLKVSPALHKTCETSNP